MSFWSESTFPSLWSATPTPFTESMNVDEEAVVRLVEHHIRLGVDGLFLAGTCGEGPWMPVRERRRLVRAVHTAASGRLKIAVQVSDDSVERILENAEMAVEDGADLAVIAPPRFLMNATPESVLAFYQEAVRRMPLPVCIYDLVTPSGFAIPAQFLKRVYLEEKVVMVKDSSGDPDRRAIALEARREREDLRLFNGDEFDCVTYLEQGYDGLLIGGAVFNGILARRLMNAVNGGAGEVARVLQERMNRLMFAVYGGEEITCWLSGLKELLVKMEIFRTRKNFPAYPLTPECDAAIREMLVVEREALLPGDPEATAAWRV